MQAIGNPKLVIGVSGGLDSTHALLVCVQACERLGLPRRFLAGLDDLLRDAAALIPVNAPPVILTVRGRMPSNAWGSSLSNVSIVAGDSKRRKNGSTPSIMIALPMVVMSERRCLPRKG